MAVGDVGGDGDVPHVEGRPNAVGAVNDDVAKFPFPLGKRTIFRPATIALYFELKSRRSTMQEKREIGGRAAAPTYVYSTTIHTLAISVVCQNIRFSLVLEV